MVLFGGCPLAQVPSCPGAQVPTCPGTQVPRCPHVLIEAEVAVQGVLDEWVGQKDPVFEGMLFSYFYQIFF